jgi:hypothetical protein
MNKGPFKKLKAPLLANPKVEAERRTRLERGARQSSSLAGWLPGFTTDLKERSTAVIILRALAQRIEVDQKEVRIMGRKAYFCVPSSLLQAQKRLVWGCPVFVPNWRATVDEDGHYCFAIAL